uniref:Uncharacterized protein n=1 Tax=Romanomermis culicivorax TaxID=13658 RepID=A0A915HRU5_ROMCU
MAFVNSLCEFPAKTIKPETPREILRFCSYKNAIDRQHFFDIDVENEMNLMPLTAGLILQRIQWIFGRADFKN